MNSFSTESTFITLDENEAAYVTGFTVKTLQKRRWERKPPKYLKVGRKVRYRLSDLKEFLDSCSVEMREVNSCIKK